MLRFRDVAVSVPDGRRAELRLFVRLLWLRFKHRAAFR